MSFLRNNKNISALIHDTNSSLGSIRAYKEQLEHKLPELGVEDNRTINNALEMIDKCVDDCIRHIDHYYIKLKKEAESK